MASSLSFQERYVHNLPQQIPIKAAQSFLLTSAIRLFTNSLEGSLFLGAAAATATLIEAVTRPILQEIFSDNPFIVPPLSVFISHFGATCLAVGIAPWMGISLNLQSRIASLILFVYCNNRCTSQGNISHCWARNVAMVAPL